MRMKISHISMFTRRMDGKISYHPFADKFFKDVTPQQIDTLRQG
jgi:hypothetical protein